MVVLPNNRLATTNFTYILIWDLSEPGRKFDRKLEGHRAVRNWWICVSISEACLIN